MRWVVTIIGIFGLMETLLGDGFRRSRGALNRVQPTPDETCDARDVPMVVLDMRWDELRCDKIAAK